MALMEKYLQRKLDLNEMPKMYFRTEEDFKYYLEFLRAIISVVNNENKGFFKNLRQLHSRYF